MLDALKQRFRGRPWTPVTLGLSGARVWRVEGTPAIYVKTEEHAQQPDLVADLRPEADRLGWLAGANIPVPEVIDVGADDRFAWLVTAAVTGRTAADPWPTADRDGVVDALADVALALHALPIVDCPFDRSLAVTVPEAVHWTERGVVDLDSLEQERLGLTAADLIAELTATRPDAEDLVVCHGDFCLPNVLLDPETRQVTGLVDVGRVGQADWHQDLALMTRSLSHEMNRQYGPGHADRLLHRYCATRPDAGPIDSERIAFYRLLDEFF